MSKISNKIAIWNNNGITRPGFFATELIQNGTEILKTTKQAGITTFTPRKFPDFSYLFATPGLSREDRLNILAYYLAYIEVMLQKGEETEVVKQEINFVKSIQNSPKTPLTYSPQELSFLENSGWKDKVEQEKMIIAETLENFIIQNLLQYSKHPENTQYKKLVNHDPKIVSLERMIKFRSIIDCSLLDAMGYEDGMLNAYIHIFNHHKFPNCASKWENEEITIYTLRDVMAGQKLFLDYGNYTQEKMFMYYGIPYQEDSQDMLPQQNNIPLISANNLAGGYTTLQKHSEQ